MRCGRFVRISFDGDDDDDDDDNSATMAMTMAAIVREKLQTSFNASLVIKRDRETLLLSNNRLITKICNSLVLLVSRSPASVHLQGEPPRPPLLPHCDDDPEQVLHCQTTPKTTQNLIQTERNRRRSRLTM